MNRAEILQVLVDLVIKVTDGEVTPNPKDLGPESIRRLGLNSMTTLALLVAVEDRFGIEWEEEVADEVLGGFEPIADYIAAQVSVDV